MSGHNRLGIRNSFLNMSILGNNQESVPDICSYLLYRIELLIWVFIGFLVQFRCNQSKNKPDIRELMPI